MTMTVLSKMNKGKGKGGSSKGGGGKLAPIFISKKKTAGATPSATAGATPPAAEESAAAPPKSMKNREIEQKGISERRILTFVMMIPFVNGLHCKLVTPWNWMGKDY